MDQQPRGHGPPADLQQVVGNHSDPEDYDGLMDEDWLDMDKSAGDTSVSVSATESSRSSSRPDSTAALDNVDDHRVPSLSLSTSLTLDIPSTTHALLQEEGQHRQDNQTPESASPTASSESDYSLLNPSADQSRKNSLSSVSGFHSLTPTVSRTGSDTPSFAEQDLFSTVLDDMALDAGIPTITSPSFSDFVQVGGSDGQDDSLASESSSVGTGCDSVRNSGDSNSGDGSSQGSTYLHIGNNLVDTPTTATTVATGQGEPQQSQSSSPSFRRRTTYRTTVEDARTSSETERDSAKKSSSRVRPTRTTVQENQRSTSDTQVPTSTMPGGLNLGLDAEIPDYKPAGSTQGAAQVPVEERQCRICLGGADEEDTLGRLISPCLCKGSMKYVHVEW